MEEAQQLAPLFPLIAKEAEGTILEVILNLFTAAKWVPIWGPGSPWGPFSDLGSPLGPHFFSRSPFSLIQA